MISAAAWDFQGHPSRPWMSFFLKTGLSVWMFLSSRKENESAVFGVSTGIGFDAAVCRDVGITPLKKYLNRLHLGKLVYLLVALKQLLFTAPCSMSISMDGGRIQQYEKVYFITVMNQKYEGGGFCFCPNASPFDGFSGCTGGRGISQASAPHMPSCRPLGTAHTF